MKAINLLTLILICCFQISYAQSTTNNKTIVRTYIEDIVNKQKLHLMANVFSEDYIWHQMDGKTTHSRQDSSHLATLRYLLKSIPDLTYTIDGMVGEGDLVAVNSTATGIIKDGFMGIAASQRKVRFKQMFFFRITNSKISEEWEVVDVAGIKDQLAK